MTAIYTCVFCCMLMDGSNLVHNTAGKKALQSTSSYMIKMGSPHAPDAFRHWPAKQTMVGVGMPVNPGAHTAEQVVLLVALVQLDGQLPPPGTAAVGF